MFFAVLQERAREFAGDFAYFRGLSFKKQAKRREKASGECLEMQECEQFVTFEKNFKKIQKALAKWRKIVYYIRWGTMGQNAGNRVPHNSLVE
jgi:hypothetical protein